MACEIIHGDCLEVMRGMADNSVDAIVTDPPYGLSFMGKKWDYDVPTTELWAECLRVLKPGGHLLAFAGTRTQHRMAVRIEDAGFEIRDMIAWVYGSGFPKSRNVCLDMDKMDGHGNRGHRIAVANRHHPDGTLEPNGEHLPAYEPKTDAAKQWQGWGTALKPALEPITMARKPLVGTVAANVLAHGTGAINVDGCRVDAGDDYTSGSHDETTKVGGQVYGWAASQKFQRCKPHDSGRWPANLIHDGSDEVVAGFPNVKGGTAVRSNSGGNTFGGETPKPPMPDLGYNDTGSAARFFKTCEHDEAASASRLVYCAKASKSDRGESNGHPTVKPTELMRYLVRLVTQPGGTVLDPFTGSGSTGKAAVLEGFEFIGIEREDEYVAIAEARIVEAQRSLGLFA